MEKISETPDAVAQYVSKNWRKGTGVYSSRDVYTHYLKSGGAAPRKRFSALFCQMLNVRKKTVRSGNKSSRGFSGIEFVGEEL